MPPTRIPIKMKINLWMCLLLTKKKAAVFFEYILTHFLCWFMARVKSQFRTPCQNKGASRSAGQIDKPPSILQFGCLIKMGSGRPKVRYLACAGSSVSQPRKTKGARPNFLRLVVTGRQVGPCSVSCSPSDGALAFYLFFWLFLCLFFRFFFCLLLWQCKFQW